jgi:hypothetical protein
MFGTSPGRHSSGDDPQRHRLPGVPCRFLIAGGLPRIGDMHERLAQLTGLLVGVGAVLTTAQRQTTADDTEGSE